MWTDKSVHIRCICLAFYCVFLLLIQKSKLEGIHVSLHNEVKLKTKHNGLMLIFLPNIYTCYNMYKVFEVLSTQELALLESKLQYFPNLLRWMEKHNIYHKTTYHVKYVNCNFIKSWLEVKMHKISSVVCNVF